jgi:LysM repeat protein
MGKNRLLSRLALAGTLTFVVAAISACYKDAGENVQPTSNRVELNDIAQPSPTVMPTNADTATPLPTAGSLITATRTLVPTTTPPGMVAPPAATPTEFVEGEAPTTGPDLGPAATATSAEPVIATPGMSDIEPSPTTPPTIDPARMPTPTAIPVEENPCIHIVQPNDTLYSIAQDNSVLLTDLVAANPSLLGGYAETTLQIGWHIQIPGCDTGTPEPATDLTATPGTGVEPAATVAPGQPTTHVVQSGETIYSIGRLYNVDPAAITAANNLANPNLIQPGQTLVIPAPAQ